jgi:hypothetical protein
VLVSHKSLKISCLEFHIGFLISVKYHNFGVSFQFHPTAVKCRNSRMCKYKIMCKGGRLLPSSLVSWSCKYCAIDIVIARNTKITALIMSGTAEVLFSGQFYIILSLHHQQNAIKH